MSTQKITVMLPAEQVAFLKTLAAKEHQGSFTSALNRSIDTLKFFIEQKEQGSTLLIQKARDAKVHEIVLK